MPFGDLDPSTKIDENRALQSTSTIITTSEWSRHRLIELYGLQRNHIVTATPGVTPAPIAPGSTSPSPTTLRSPTPGSPSSGATGPGAAGDQRPGVAAVGDQGPTGPGPADPGSTSPGAISCGSTHPGSNALSTTAPTSTGPTDPSSTSTHLAHPGSNAPSTTAPTSTDPTDPSSTSTGSTTLRSTSTTGPGKTGSGATSTTGSGTTDPAATSATGTTEIGSTRLGSARLSATGTGPVLLCVAAIGPHKGQDVLVEALGRVADHDWTCTLVGAPVDVDYFAELSTKIDVLGLGQRIHLAGPQHGAALDGYYNAADLLVHPTRGETYGMVAAEALARGIPVLGTTAKGLPEAIGSAAPPGWLVSPGDPAALAAALRRWLNDPDLRTRLRAAALTRRATLTGWDVTARRVAAALTNPGPDQPRP
ncbi:glycosyltransferase [Dactylosporangium matsuzakiense]|nr:glycosyltransferase [Dactylosporangium matsuzakiense]